jgi:hypothetical protein
MKETLKQISDLVECFERNIEAYRSLPYNEIQLRREFIDPFAKVQSVRNSSYALNIINS